MKQYEFTITLREAEPWEIDGHKGFGVVFGPGANYHEEKFTGTLAEALDRRLVVGSMFAGLRECVSTISIPGGVRAPVGFKQITFYETFNF